MAKVNVNKSTHEELVEIAGLRPRMADAIVKFRDQHGTVADVNALSGLSGIGGTTLEQLREALDFGAQEGAGAIRPAGVDEPRTNAIAAGSEFAPTIPTAVTLGTGDAVGREERAVEASLAAAEVALTDLERAVRDARLEAEGRLRRVDRWLGMLAGRRAEGRPWPTSP